MGFNSIIEKAENGNGSNKLTEKLVLVLNSLER